MQLRLTFVFFLKRSFEGEELKIFVQEDGDEDEEDEEGGPISAGADVPALLTSIRAQNMLSRTFKQMRQEYEAKIWEPNYSKLEQQYMAAARQTRDAHQA